MGFIDKFPYKEMGFIYRFPYINVIFNAESLQPFVHQMHYNNTTMVDDCICFLSAFVPT